MWTRRPKTSNPESRADLLAAKPIRHSDAKLAQPSEGVPRITVPLVARGGFFFRIPDGATKTFELDALGLFVWNHCDGETTVQEIIEQFAGEFKINLRAAEVSTLQFLQLLSGKGLIGRAIAKDPD